VQSISFKVVELSANEQAFFCFCYCFLHNFSLFFHVRGEREGTIDAHSDRSSHILKCLLLFVLFAFVSSFAIDILVKLLPMPKAPLPCYLRICHIRMRGPFIDATV